MPYPQQQPQGQYNQPQGQYSPPQGQFNQPQNPQNPQHPNGGFDNMVSNPSLHGAYQGHAAAAQPISPQTTGNGVHPPSVPSPSPSPVVGAAAAGHGHGHGQDGAYELSTVKGDPALVELGEAK